jgi:hypothetical protein
MKTLAALFAATAIAAMPTPAAAQYGPPPIGGPIGAILDGIFGPLPPPPPPPPPSYYYDPDEYGPPPCYGCPPPPPQARPPVRGNLGGPYTRDREDEGNY